jgi:hypothetical protein
VARWEKKPSASGGRNSEDFSAQIFIVEFYRYPMPKMTFGEGLELNLKSIVVEKFKIL